MALYQLFSANFKILARNWRGLFWNIALPIALYIGLSLLNINGFTGLGINYSGYLLPGVIAMTIMQTGVYSLAYWLIDLRERGVLKRFAVTPLSSSELITSLILSRIILMFFQIILLSLIGWYFFGVVFNGSFIAIILLTLFGGSVFLSLGFLISIISNSYDEAAPITTIVNLIFTFLGNVFFPVQTLPLGLREIGRILPLTFLADGIRANFLNNIPFTKSLKDIAILLVWLLVVFSFTAWAFKLKQE